MSRNIVSNGANAVFEVDQVEQQVRESRKFRVEFTLGDQCVAAAVLHLVLGEVLEDLHEADLVTVRQVVEVFEEGLLLRGVLIVITVLLDTFTCHVLSVRTSLLLGCLSEVFSVDEGSSETGSLSILEVELGNVLLDRWVS